MFLKLLIVVLSLTTLSALADKRPVARLICMKGKTEISTGGVAVKTDSGIAVLATANNVRGLTDCVVYFDDAPSKAKPTDKCKLTVNPKWQPPKEGKISAFDLALCVPTKPLAMPKGIQAACTAEAEPSKDKTLKHFVAVGKGFTNAADVKVVDTKGSEFLGSGSLPSGTSMSLAGTVGTSGEFQVAGLGLRNSKGNAAGAGIVFTSLAHKDVKSFLSKHKVASCSAASAPGPSKTDAPNDLAKNDVPKETEKLEQEESEGDDKIGAVEDADKNKDNDKASTEGVEPEPAKPVPRPSARDLAQRSKGEKTH